MAKLSITQIKWLHNGADVWVIASGPSAGLVDPEFFDGKITIGVNRVWGRFKTTYIVVKEQAVLQQAINTGSRVVASRFNCGDVDEQENRARGNYYIFDHHTNGHESIDLDVVGTDKLVVSFSTITSAMHLAAYIGGKNIILVGHDCGTIDGLVNYPGYPQPLARQPGFYEDFLSRIEPQSIQLRARLEEVFGCRIYSLNPWINIGLEDHNYAKK